MWIWVVYLTALVSVTAGMGLSEEAAKANSRFSLDLLKQIFHQEQNRGKNIFYSPFSISTALAMTSLGAKGNTLKEINKVFHFDDINLSNEKEDAIHAAYGEISSKYSEETKNYVLVSANKMYLDDTFNVSQKFEDNVKNYYKTRPDKIIMADGQGENTINKWVKFQTRDKIEELFKPGSFSTETKVVLVNAVYFKGEWEKSFKPNNTKLSSFHVDVNEEKQVETMVADTFFHYYRDEELKFNSVQLPYLGEQLVMLVVLPDEINGLAELISDLQEEKVTNALHSAAEMRLHVEIPKFKIEADYSNLKTQLCHLGVRDLFDAQAANLSGISPIPLVVNQIAHKAFVEVTEQGTEAAAATGIDIMLRSKTQEFKANHPFYFAIIDKTNSMILFNGVVNNPLATTTTADAPECHRQASSFQAGSTSSSYKISSLLALIVLPFVTLSLPFFN